LQDIFRRHKYGLPFHQKPLEVEHKNCQKTAIEEALSQRKEFRFEQNISSEAKHYQKGISR